MHTCVSYMYVTFEYSKQLCRTLKRVKDYCTAVVQFDGRMNQNITMVLYGTSTMRAGTGGWVVVAGRRVAGRQVDGGRQVGGGR